MFIIKSVRQKITHKNLYAITRKNNAGADCYFFSLKRKKEMVYPNAPVIFLFCCWQLFQNPLLAQPKTTNAGTSFQPYKYTELPLGSIQPQGWLKNQLAIMRNGSSGHLDEVYWKVK